MACMLHIQMIYLLTYLQVLKNLFIVLLALQVPHAIIKFLVEEIFMDL